MSNLKEKKFKIKVTYKNYKNEKISYTFDNELDVKLWFGTMLKSTEIWKSPLKIEAIKNEKNEQNG